MLLRERPRSAIALPTPAPLPNLRDALPLRAAIFGPVEADAVPAVSRGPWRALGAVARQVADLLDPAGR